MGIYDFTFKTRKGEEKTMADYKGKTLLIVNTATGCGFTPQYKELQAIYEEFKDKDFEILDFPCNQFGNQAPGTDEEIHTFCTGRFGITFPQFAKIEVNGDNALPLFKYLTDNTTFDGFDGKNPLTKILMTVIAKDKKSSSIKWNFTKFLISKDGEIVKRFEPTSDMKSVRESVKNELNR